MNLHSHPELAERQRPAGARSGRGVTAVLGPTNTGKTHLAIERMMAQPSGMIGLPLRLLAREVYGRVVERVGAANVALITGEEKILPPGARFRVCTVEAMPPDAKVHFLAIDEVQLAADLNRGHIFTDRILNMRGTHETMLLGASTLRPALERLLPGISVITRPRMSKLEYAGSKKITRLPPRSAIVAFSADEVYAIAELIRRQRGAAAVVLGSLSPRTRNAQVALYQSGDVDFLVATDAIGMGLNLDVDHVAFAQDQKFDGHQNRRLKPAEFAQIAGRAGRHTSDGTFGVTSRVLPFEDELVERLEGHEFPPEKLLQWRNRVLDFTSINDLAASLDIAPTEEGLVRAPQAIDQRALSAMAAQGDIRDMTTSQSDVERLWSVAQIPDYRRIAPANHSDMLSTIYRDLTLDGAIDENWFSNQVSQTDNTAGEIDALSNRIAHIRTWTFVSHRAGWLKDAAHWQERTRAIEDRLSDALHERLTKRFVDRRTSVLMKRLREADTLEAEIAPSGAVTVEGHHVGELTGFRFTPDRSGGDLDAKAALAAARQALASEITARAERIGAASNADLSLDANGILRWSGAPVGQLAASEDPLQPRVLLLADEQLNGPPREKVLARVSRFVRHQIDTHLAPLRDITESDGLSGLARGVAFRLAENFGSIERREVADDVKALEQADRATLRKRGVRFGFYSLFMPALLKPAPAGLAALLWGIRHDSLEATGRADVLGALSAGRTSFPAIEGVSDETYRLAGFRKLGPKAVRIDILERLADLIRPAQQWRFDAAKPGKRPEGAADGAGFMATPAMLSILGATHDDMAEMLKALGYRGESLRESEFAARAARWDGAAEPARKEPNADDAAPLADIAPVTDLPLDAAAATVVPGTDEAPVAPVSESVSECLSLRPRRKRRM